MVDMVVPRHGAACDAREDLPAADQGRAGRLPSPSPQQAGAARAGRSVMLPRSIRFMTHVDAILARLLALHPKRIDLSLDRMWRILDALGHPERRLPPVIHVAGTNGKGSTVAFMRAMLEAAGKRVHVYTSPNLVRINERYRIAGKLVEDDALAEALATCERANGDAPITVFEIETAAGFLLFAEHAGRRDAAGSRARRPARCDQCRRASARQRHHAGVDGSHRISWRHAREDRLGKSRDHEARRARGDRPAGRRPDGGDRAAMPMRSARRCMCWGRNG